MRNPRARLRVACVSVALVAALCAVCFSVAAADDEHNDDHHDDTFKVHGTVRSNDGAPIAGASITISMPGRLQNEPAATRAASFVLHDVRDGTYALRATAPGYQPISQRTVTLGRSNSTLSIMLSAATTNSLTVIGTVQASAGETVSTASAPTIR